MEVSVINFTLIRNLAGRLQLTTSDGIVHDGIYPVRAFPIAAPEAGLSLLSKAGHELVWIIDLAALPIQTQKLIAEELAQREFMPAIKRINQVSSFATPSIWNVETDRGHTQLTLKGEDQIWRITQNSVLMIDSQGVNFIIRDLAKLDKHSRKLLDRFL